MNNNKNESPLKVTLNHPIYKKQLKLINQQQNLQSNHQTQTYQTNYSSHINYIKTYINYINGSYYGHVNEYKNPQKIGILIDDEFNFFLSNFKDKLMNGLTYIKLMNGTQIYGTFINGQMNGYNVIHIGSMQIFLECKSNNPKYWSPFFIINKQTSIMYLMRVKQNDRKRLEDFKLQIVQRKELNFSKYSQTQMKRRQKILQNYKIPKYLYSSYEFLCHFSANNHNVMFKSIKLQDNKQYYFLSLSQNNKSAYLNNLNKNFKPFRPIIKQTTQTLNPKSKINKLGLIVQTNHNLKTKCIGSFDHSMRLNGVGFTSNKQADMIGLFKNDFITQQFYYGKFDQLKIQEQDQQDQMILKIKKKIKKSIRLQNMRSLFYRNQFIYFNQINQIVLYCKKISKYVRLFQKQYQEKINLQKGSATQSNSEFQDVNLKYSTQKKSNKFIQQKKQNEKLSERIYGRIVNSRSPLRSPFKSKSRSPSEIQTNRKTEYMYNNKSHDKKYSYFKNIKNDETQNIQTYRKNFVYMDKREKIRRINIQTEDLNVNFTQKLTSKNKQTDVITKKQIKRQIFWK